MLSMNVRARFLLGACAVSKTVFCFASCRARESLHRPLLRRGALYGRIRAQAAADIIKRAMIDVDAWLQDGEFDALMVMQVHDELVFEVAESQVDTFKEEVKTRMQNAAKLSVALTVEAKSGTHWDEAH
jgi:DNA polymerase I-like protein with 3'-5' exonuclease and polymerase domains